MVNTPPLAGLRISSDVGSWGSPTPIPVDTMEQTLIMPMRFGMATWSSRSSWKRSVASRRHRPTRRAARRTPGGGSPVGPSAQGRRHGQFTAFGNTDDFYRNKILGSINPKNGRPRGGDADYATALRLGHSVEPIIMEVSGGLTPAACKLLRTLVHVHGAGLGADTNAPWCARSFKSIYTQPLSVALQRAAAEELLDTIRCDASWNDSA